MAVLISPDTGLKSGIAIVGHGMLLAPLVVVNLGINIYFALCPDHVILTGHQMTNLVSNFKYLLSLCFLKAAKF